MQTMSDEEPRDACDECGETTRLGDEREQPESDEPLYCDPCAQILASDVRRLRAIEQAARDLLAAIGPTDDDVPGHLRPLVLLLRIACHREE